MTLKPLQIQRTVEDMEDIIEGYTRIFNEEQNISIKARLTQLQEISFDETFTNV